MTKESLDAEFLQVQGDVMTSGRFSSWEEFLQANVLTDVEVRELLENSLLIKLMTEAHGGPKEVEQTYAFHILVGDLQTAKEVLDKLAAGESFEQLAQTYSTDTGSKEQGGDLGWFPRGVMVSEFEEAAFSLPVGETSLPVQTQFGYHIIRVVARQVRPLEGERLAQVQHAAFAEWFQEERQKANIERLIAFDVSG